jgi:hypothetical protein
VRVPEPLQGLRREVCRDLVDGRQPTDRWRAKLDADPAGGIAPDVRSFPHGGDFGGLQVHQTWL